MCSTFIFICFIFSYAKLMYLFCMHQSIENLLYLAFCWWRYYITAGHLILGIHEDTVKNTNSLVFNMHSIIMYTPILVHCLWFNRATAVLTESDKSITLRNRLTLDAALKVHYNQEFMITLFTYKHNNFKRNKMLLYCMSFSCSIKVGGGGVGWDGVG